MNTHRIDAEALTRGMSLPSTTGHGAAREIAYVDWRPLTVRVVFMDGSDTEVDRSADVDVNAP